MASTRKNAARDSDVLRGMVLYAFAFSTANRTHRVAFAPVKKKEKNHNETLMDSRLIFFCCCCLSSYDSSWLYIILFVHFVRAYPHSFFLEVVFAFVLSFSKWKCQSTQLFRKKHLYLFLCDFIHNSTISLACVHDFPLALNSWSCSQSVGTVRNCGAIS